MSAAVNLAARQFANTRPIRRVAIALWVLGSALAVFAGVLYWRSLFGIEGRRAEIAAVDRATVTERARLAAADSALRSFDLRRQNVEASYLDARIHERTFGWSTLFEHLTEVLPKKVRLLSLSPQSGEGRVSATARTRRASAAAGRVYLQMAGSAATDEDLTDLLDHLFASRWFADPTLPAERNENGAITFTLNVWYLPGGKVAGGAR